MKELHNYRFSMIIRGGGDIWALYGKNSDAGFCDSYVSCPVEFDEENLIIKTASGSVYRLVNPAGDSEAIHQEIRNAVANKGYEIH